MVDYIYYCIVNVVYVYVLQRLTIHVADVHEWEWSWALRCIHDWCKSLKMFIARISAKRRGFIPELQYRTHEGGIPYTVVYLICTLVHIVLESSECWIYFGILSFALCSSQLLRCLFLTILNITRLSEPSYWPMYISNYLDAIRFSLALFHACAMKCTFIKKLRIKNCLNKEEPRLHYFETSTNYLTNITITQNQLVPTRAFHKNRLIINLMKD